MKYTTRFTIAFLIAALASAPAAWAQVSVLSAFPSDDVTDTRMLSFGCVGTDTFEQDVSISISVPGDATEFDILVFDGETSGPSGNWDLRAGSPAGRELVFELYFDPEKVASTADLVASWTGNSANPLVSPSADPNKQWTTAQATMPNNDWWTVTVDTPPDPLNDPAAAPSGNRFYHLLIKKNSPCVTGEELVSNLKFATSTPETFILSQFGFEAAFRAGANDRNIIYPAHPAPGPIPPLDAPTTYDGTYDFFVNVPLNAVELEIFNGDFDHGINTAVGGGTFPGATGIPSGADLSDPTVVGGICADTDDANTPNDYSDFPPALVLGGAVPEGANAPGDPPDDNKLDIARRGWLENQAPANPNPTNAGCVRYSVFDPNGVEYSNNNPSGNLEWQRFRIATINAADPNTADYGPAVAQDGVTFVTTDSLPAGVWRISIEGLDLANLNFWFIENGTCALVNGEPSCPPTAYLLGDTAFFDFDGDGVQDPGDAGIPGVIVNLFLDPTEPPVATRITGDTSAPEWDDCVANNTGLPGDTDGLYCFGVDDPDTYTVRIAPENFDPGGALFDLFSSTGGEEITDVLTGCGLACGPEDNVLTYDFGYTALGSLGDRLWLDRDSDGVQDDPADEPGINGVTVELRDPTDDSLIATDVTEGDGDYLFDNLPAGDYKVVVVTSTLPPGLSQTFDVEGPLDDAATVPLGFNEDRDDVDFGYVDECLPELDFETDFSGHALAAGDVVTTQFAGYGITVTTDDPVNHPAMIFDSANPTGGDFDLGTPNQTAGGPGVGSGGEIGQPGQNVVPLGNVLILSEDGDASDPDDNGAGGTIIFTFANAVRVDRVDILDIDEGMAGTVSAFDGGGAMIGSAGMADNLGNNSVQSVALGASGVRRLEVHFPGSGAVSGILFCVEDSVCLPDLDFEGLDAGTVVGGQFPGVSVSTGDPAHPPMIFDSAAPTGGDVDLGTPNADFGGPGVGSGGAAGELGANAVPRGKVLIVSEDGDSSDPDDNGAGGTITFTFDQPVFTSSVGILDVDGDEAGGTVKAFDAPTGGNLVASGAMLTYGNNSYQSVPLAAEGVRRLEVFFPSSGAVSEVVFCVEPQECVPKRVRDDFETSSFANDDGPDAWAGDWIENDPEAGGGGPSAGQVRVHNGLLTLDDYPDTGGEPSAARQVDLSGATSATLRLEFATTAGVDSDDAVTLEVSADGGATWTTLEVFTGIVGAVQEARSYGISGFISAQTQVRVRVTNKYGGSNELFCLTFLEIETDCGDCRELAVADAFDVQSYANNDGPDSWSGNWIENDPEAGGGGPAAGQVRVLGGFLKLDDYPDTGGEPSAAREVDLTGAASATFSFDFLTTAGVDTSDAVTVEVSADGGATWSTLEVFTGIYGATSGSRSYDITAWASPRTQVRFRVTNKYGGSDEFFKVDRVEISSTCPQIEICPCTDPSNWDAAGVGDGGLIWDDFVLGFFEAADTTCSDAGSLTELLEDPVDFGDRIVSVDSGLPQPRCRGFSEDAGVDDFLDVTAGEAAACRQALLDIAAGNGVPGC